jgi:hypothetical protein
VSADPQSFTFRVVSGDVYFDAAGAHGLDDLTLTPIDVVHATGAAAAVTALSPEEHARDSVRVVDALTDRVYLVMRDELGFLAAHDPAATAALAAEWAAASAVTA